MAPIYDMLLGQFENPGAPAEIASILEEHSPEKTHLVLDEETAVLALLICFPGGKLWAFSANVEDDPSLWILTKNDELIADEDDYPEVFAAAMDKKLPSTLGSEVATRRFTEAFYDPYVIGS